MQREKIQFSFNVKNEKIILILYLIVLACGILLYSTVPFKQGIRTIWKAGILLLFICFALLQRHSRHQWYILLILLGICIISSVFYKVNVSFFYVTFIMFSMSNILPKKILSLSAKIIFLIIACLTVCSTLHLIPNLIFYRDGTVRQSLGTIYPLTYAGFIFYGCAGWTSVCKDNLKNILILFLLAGYVFLITGARNDAIDILLLIIACISDHFNYKVNKYLSLVCIFIVYIACIFSIFITKFLPYYSNTYIFLNNMLDGRLGLQYLLNNSYKPTLFGQVIQQIGFGGNISRMSNYFYIDNSYIRLLYMSGIILTILMFYLITNLIFNLYKLGLYKQIYIILIIMISGITEDSLMNGSINIFLYILLATSINLKNSFEASNIWTTENKR